MESNFFKVRHSLLLVDSYYVRCEEGYETFMRYKKVCNGPEMVNVGLTREKDVLKNIYNTTVCIRVRASDLFAKYAYRILNSSQ